MLSVFGYLLDLADALERDPPSRKSAKIRKRSLSTADPLAEPVDTSLPRMLGLSRFQTSGNRELAGVLGYEDNGRIPKFVSAESLDLTDSKRAPPVLVYSHLGLFLRKRVTPPHTLELKQLQPFIIQNDGRKLIYQALDQDQLHMLVQMVHAQPHECEIHLLAKGKQVAYAQDGKADTKAVAGIPAMSPVVPKSVKVPSEDCPFIGSHGKYLTLFLTTAHYPLMRQIALGQTLHGQPFSFVIKNANGSGYRAIALSHCDQKTGDMILWLMERDGTIHSFLCALPERVLLTLNGLMRACTFNGESDQMFPGADDAQLLFAKQDPLDTAQEFKGMELRFERWASPITDDDEMGFPEMDMNPGIQKPLGELRIAHVQP